MSKKYAIFLVCLFAALLATVFVANAVTPDKTFSPMENRMLSQMPTPTVGKAGNILSGEFMQDFESYVTDQFVLRDGWIALKAASEVTLGKQENNGVYLCAQDTLIKRFTAPSNAKRVEQIFGYVDAFAGKVDIPVYFSLVPEKVSVWADRLPVGAPNADESVYLTRGSQVTKAKWIDLAPAMNAHSAEEIYFRTDHHWNTLGAYYGYEALMKGMGVTPTALSGYTKATVADDFLGTTFSSAGVRWVKPDAIDLYVPANAGSVDRIDTDENGKSVDLHMDGLYKDSQLQEKDKYSMFLGGNTSVSVIRSNVAPEGAPKLLIIRDSFSDCMAPYLTAHFSEIHLLDLRYYKQPVSSYIADKGIDQTLVLYSVSNFITDANLALLPR